jgi:hypothetical protein
MKSKEAVRNNYDDGETQILERDLSNTLDMWFCLNWLVNY